MRSPFFGSSHANWGRRGSATLGRQLTASTIFGSRDLDGIHGNAVPSSTRTTTTTTTTPPPCSSSSGAAVSLRALSGYALLLARSITVEHPRRRCWIPTMGAMQVWMLHRRHPMQSVSVLFTVHYSPNFRIRCDRIYRSYQPNRRGPTRHRSTTR